MVRKIEGTAVLQRSGARWALYPLRMDNVVSSERGREETALARAGWMRQEVCC